MGYKLGTPTPLSKGRLSTLQLSWELLIFSDEDTLGPNYISRLEIWNEQ